jgi:hypothetical protein
MTPKSRHELNKRSSIPEPMHGRSSRPVDGVVSILFVFFSSPQRRSVPCPDSRAPSRRAETWALRQPSHATLGGMSATSRDGNGG